MCLNESPPRAIVLRMRPRYADVVICRYVEKLRLSPRMPSEVLRRECLLPVRQGRLLMFQFDQLGHAAHALVRGAEEAGVCAGALGT